MSCRPIPDVKKHKQIPDATQISLFCSAMATKAAFVRENITIDEEAMTWTCNQCFQDRMGKPGMENKPLRTYAMIGTSNIARHFDEFHKVE